MAFTHGKNSALYANGYDLSAYMRNATSEIEVSTADSTVWGATATDHLVGILSGQISGDGLLDASVSAVHPVLTAAFATADSEVLHLPAGDALGNPGMALSGTDTKYSVNSPLSDVVSVSFEVTANSAACLPVSVIQPLAAITTTGNKTGIDGGAATTTGWTAWLHCTAFTGTDCTIKLIDSATSVSSGMSDVSGGGFTQILAARASEKIVGATGATLRRYPAINVAGTFTSITVNVVIARMRG